MPHLGEAILDYSLNGRVRTSLGNAHAAFAPHAVYRCAGADDWIAIAVTWAMDHAPMPRTEKGKPDTTARHVLQALAEHASPTGTDAHPSVLRIQYRTGYDRTTVQRAWCAAPPAREGARSRRHL